MDRERFIGELLYRFEFLSAGMATILVDRHTSISMVSAAQNKTGRARLGAPGFA
jgi:hypothetical protein